MKLIIAYHVPLCIRGHPPGSADFPLLRDRVVVLGGPLTSGPTAIQDIHLALEYSVTMDKIFKSRHTISTRKQW